MEVIHHHCKIVKRSAGKSAVAAAAYRAGERLHNKYDGMTHDYTRRRGVVYTDILLPSHAPKSFMDRGTLWNSVEQVEKASNSQLAREVEFSLPNNLDRKTQIQMVRRHVQTQFASKGMCADIAIHDKGDGNPHAHILLTMRLLEKNGDWGMKAKREYILDKHGQRIQLKSGDFKSRKISMTDWDSKDNAERWHSAWAIACNREFERVGSDRRVTHQSYADQGLSIEPTKHLGWEAHQVEKRGGYSDISHKNQEIKHRNAQLADIQREIKQLDKLEQQEIERLEKLRILEQNVRMETNKPKPVSKVLYTAPTAKPAEAALPRKVQQPEPTNMKPAPKPTQPIKYQSGTKQPPITQTPAKSIQPIKSQPRPQQPPITQTTAEQTPAKPVKTQPPLTLSGIRNEYIELELEIKKQRHLANDLRDTLRRLDAKYEDLRESVQIIRNYDEQIQQLHQQHRDLASTTTLSRIMLDSKINKLTNSREQAQSYLSREHGVSNPSQLQDKFNEISRDRAKAQQQQSQLRDITPLIERQRELEEHYKREHSRAEPSQVDNQNRTRKLSLTDRVAVAEAENRLKKLTEPDRQQSQDRDKERRR